MKQTIIAICLTTLFLSAACSNGNSNQGNSVKTETTDSTKMAYQCPMDCEKGKVYTEPGKCPVCEMDLKEIETK